MTTDSINPKDFGSERTKVRWQVTTSTPVDTKIKAKNKPIYFTKLELENIRSFGGSQCLDLTDDKRRPAQWTLILGNNGVGKTTLLQCLARMRPRFNKEPDVSQDSQPDWLDSDLAREEEEENDVLKGLTR